MKDVDKLLKELSETDPAMRNHVLREKMNEFLETTREETGTDAPSRKSIDAREILSRFGYHRATEITEPMHVVVRQIFINAALSLNDLLPEGRAKSMCYTELENAAMWANKAVAELAPVVYE